MRGGDTGGGGGWGHFLGACGCVCGCVCVGGGVVVERERESVQEGRERHASQVRHTQKRHQIRTLNNTKEAI